MALLQVAGLFPSVPPHLDPHPFVSKAKPWYHLHAGIRQSGNSCCEGISLGLAFGGCTEPQALPHRRAALQHRKSTEQEDMKCGGISPQPSTSTCSHLCALPGLQQNAGWGHLHAAYPTSAKSQLCHTYTCFLTNTHPMCNSHRVYVTSEFALRCQMHSIHHLLSVEQMGGKGEPTTHAPVAEESPSHLPRPTALSGQGREKVAGQGPCSRGPFGV